MSNLYISSLTPAIDVDGRIAPGATRMFTYSGTTVPAPVYTDETLATPLPNPVEALASGKFPNIFLSKIIAYRVREYDGDGNLIGETDPVYGQDPALTATQQVMLGGTVLAQVGGRIYDTQTALNADLSPADDDLSVVIADPDPTKIDFYRKVGGTGPGSWAKLGFNAAMVQQYSVAAAASAGAAAGSADEADASAAAAAASEAGVAADALAATNAASGAAISEANASNSAGVAITGATNASIQAARAEDASRVASTIVGQGPEALALGLINRTQLLALQAQVDGTVPGWIKAVRVSINGWYLEVDIDSSLAGGTWDLSRLMLSSYDWGFTESCTKIIRERRLGVRGILQLPYPNGAQDDIVTVGSTTTFKLSLAEQMFSRARKGGNFSVYTEIDPRLVLMAGAYTRTGVPSPVQALDVTNNSLEPYPVPFAHLNQVPKRNLDTTSWQFGIWGDHYNVMFERPFAAARCTVIGGTSGRVRVRTTTSVRSSKIKTCASIEMGVTLDASDIVGFTSGEIVTESWEAYPWIGDTPALSVVGGYGTAVTLPVVTHGFNLPKVYAYRSTAGNDGTGVASTTEATAAAAPFLTEHKALYAAWQVNVAAGRNHLGGVEIVFADGQDHQLSMVQTSGFPPATLMTLEDCIAGPCRPVYRPVAGATACRIIQRVSTGEGTLPPLVHVKDFTAIYCPGNTSTICLDARAGQLSPTYMPDVWVDNCPYTDDGGANTNTIHVHRAGLLYKTRSTDPTVSTQAIRAFGNNMHNVRLVRDCDISQCGGGNPWLVNGVKALLMTGGFSYTDAAVTNIQFNDGMTFANCEFRRGSASAVMFETGRANSVGYSLTNVLAESYGHLLGIMRLGGDGQNYDLKNLYRRNVGFYGNRDNDGYEDSFVMTADYPTQQRKKLYSLTYSSIWEWNNKVDQFQTNGLAIHTWNVSYHVGFAGNAYLKASSDASSAPSRVAWFGRCLGPGEFFLGAYLTGVVVDYQAANNPSVGTGGGNYMPASGSLLLGKTTPATRNTPVDLYNTPWNPAGGALGPIERV